MGGNALKQIGITTRRYDKAEYEAISKEVIASLQSCYLSSVSIPSYRNKETFGDLDLLVLKVTPWSPDLVEGISKYIKSKGYVINGSVVSIEYKDFQVDLIACPEDYFDFSHKYYSYNDLGNLVGRVAHKLGLKFGHDGLSYIYRTDNDTRVLGTFVLTTDFLDALHFLGFDTIAYLRGFDSLEDIYKFTASSPYFNPAIYQLDNRNHAARIRDKKRSTYMGFLKWLEEPKQQSLPAFEWNKDKTAYLPKLFNYFARESFEAWYNERTEEEKLRKQFADKFNGELVSEWLGLEGSRLGEVLKEVKALPWFRDFVLYSTNHQLASWFKDRNWEP